MERKAREARAPRVKVDHVKMLSETCAR
jgi:hypothetical protein